jgi:hypothetical protein
MMMRKKAKKRYARGGMPSIEESVKSGNRVSRQVVEETKKMMPEKKRTRPSPGESVKSGNRVAKQTAAEMRHMGMKKGGKVKRYADGGPVSIMDNQDEEMRALMEANLAAVRRREAEEMAAKAAPKPKPKPRPAPPTKKPETPTEKPETPPAKPVATKPAPAKRPGLKERIQKQVGSKLRGLGRSLGKTVRAPFEAANPYKKAAGGKVSSRGDGIARKGKTKGKMI